MDFVKSLELVPMELPIHYFHNTTDINKLGLGRVFYSLNNERGCLEIVFCDIDIQCKLSIIYKNMEYYMKDLIIKTVDIMVIAFVVILTLSGFIGGWVAVGFFSGLGIGIMAFLASSMMAGTWIVFTRMLERLKSIDESLKKQVK